VTLQRPPDWDEPITLPELAAPSRILVAFDGSHCAIRALAWAELVGRTGGAEVLVVSAYEPPLTLRGRGAAYVDEARDYLADEARSLASESVALLTAKGVRARGLVVAGEPARAILDTAEDEEADVIILGRSGVTAELRGLGGALNRFRDLLAGGVADKVGRHAVVPVLLVS
jgi:nucleotide-binding universal stress UspA family protein